jgi:hypothetical protein
LGICLYGGDSLGVVPSFYYGGSDIVKGYLLSQAHETFIHAERERGISDVYVKTPIPVRDSHSGLSGGIDILSDPDNYEYKIHNTAKSLFYDIHSLTGVETGDATHLKDSLKAFLDEQSKERQSVKNLFLIIYQNWSSK